MATGRWVPHTTPVAPDRAWDVLLLGGASGTGKSAVSYPLARRYGVPVLEVDDLVEALLATTTPDTHPDLHYWRTHPGAASFPAERIVDLQIATARALEPAVAAVIANHLVTNMPVVIEGDYLLPELAARDSFAGTAAAGRVRAVVLHEPDPARIEANYLVREPGDGAQHARAVASAAFGDWLAAEATRCGVPVAPARPWADVLHRVEAMLTS